MQQTGVKCIASFKIGRCVLININRVEYQSHLRARRAQFFWLFVQSVEAKFGFVLISAVNYKM